MLAKRIIACLDVKDGRTVKGTNFVGLRDAGDPVQLARMYSEQGVDELVFLDITATTEKRSILIDLVEKVATEIDIPFTVGGGIRKVDDIGALLSAGADKVSINSAALNTPTLITEAVERFGSQCIVLAIDAKRVGDEWIAYVNGGRKSTGVDAVAWAVNGVGLGAGEILITSMDTDGVKNGFDLRLTRAISDAVGVPVIASGGAGKPGDFFDVFTAGRAEAALAASIFHFQEIGIGQLKSFLKTKGLEVRAKTTS